MKFIIGNYSNQNMKINEDNFFWSTKKVQYKKIILCSKQIITNNQ